MTNSRAPYSLYSDDSQRRTTVSSESQAVRLYPRESEDVDSASETTESNISNTEYPTATSLHSVTNNTTTTTTIPAPIEPVLIKGSPTTAETPWSDTEAETPPPASDFMTVEKIDPNTISPVKETAAVSSTTTEAVPVLTHSEPASSADIEKVELNNAEAETSALDNAAKAKAAHLPGAYLKHIREQKHLSIEHIGDKLCLHSGLMRSLEADDYERLPAPVFVRGYLRSYANLLDEPADQVLMLYTQQEQRGIPPLTLHTTQTKTQTSSGDPWFKIISFGLFIALMVLMTLWKLYPEQNSGAALTTPLLPAPTRDTMEENSGAMNLGQGQSLPLSSQPLSSMQPIPLSSSDSDIVYTPPNEDNADAPNAAGTTTITPDGNTNTGTTGTTVVNAADAETAPPAEAEGNANKMTLTLSANAWMQINDKEGKQLFLGTGQKGKTLDLEGTPPFKVRVGNYDGVSVTYKGKAQALNDFPREGKRVYIIGSAAE